MRRITTRLPMAALLCAAFVTLIWPASTAEPLKFSNSKLKGSYSVLLNKWLSDPSSFEEAIVAVFNFDGAGNVTISSFTDNEGDVVTTGTGSGTYTVNSDGTGTINVSLSGGSGTFTSGTFTIVLNAGGKGFQTILTTCSPLCGQDVFSGTAVATQETSFSNASLKGTFEFLNLKWAIPPTNANNVLGLLTFDGTGNVAFSATSDIAGTVTTLSGNGTYSVNADGSGSIALTSGSSSIGFAIGINSKNTGLQWVDTGCSGCGSGQVETGTATHQ